MPPRTKNLRSVAPDEAPPEPAKPPKPKTLAEAIESGTYLEILLAQRRQVVTDLPGEKGPAKAALHRQLSLLSKEIAQLEAKARQERDEDGDDEDADEEWDGTWSGQATS